MGVLQPQHWGDAEDWKADMEVIMNTHVFMASFRSHPHNHRATEIVNSSIIVSSWRKESIYEKIFLTFLNKSLL